MCGVLVVECLTYSLYYFAHVLCVCLGADDVENICKIVSRMVSDGALINITAKRTTDNGYITYSYSNRI